jgi:hypothetical protein
LRRRGYGGRGCRRAGGRAEAGTEMGAVYTNHLIVSRDREYIQLDINKRNKK